MTEEDVPTLDEQWPLTSVVEVEPPTRCMTVAEAYHQLNMLMPDDTFCLHVGVWKFAHYELHEPLRFQAKYSLYCCEHGTSHAYEVKSLEEVIRLVKSAHRPDEVIEKALEPLADINDIGVLDREMASGEGGPQL